jgi:glycerate dehydrogenase
MKIVITDGFTLNPGDLSWKKFETLGEVFYYDRTSVDEISDRVKDADVIVTNKTHISAETIQSCKTLKIIAVTATGFNVVDVPAATAKKVLVCNVPEYGTHSVAQHAIALLLELSNRVGVNNESVQAGEWSSSIDWSYSKSSIIELKDKVFGIVGMGRIGNQTANIATALGMQIIYHRGNALQGNATKVSMQDLFQQSDFISLHCPLRPDNGKFVNRELLSRMKSTAFLINTSRGQLLDEEALASVLSAKLIAGAALDVLSKEPPPENHPLIGLKNCVITPHTAWLSREARSRILETSFENVKSALRGSPQNVVS